MNTYDSTFERAHSHEFRMVFGYFHFHVFRRLWWSFWSKRVQKDHHKPKTRLARTISFWNTYLINLLRGSVVEMLGLGVPAKYHNTRRWIRTLRTTSQIDTNWSNLVEISTIHPDRDHVVQCVSGLFIVLNHIDFGLFHYSMVIDFLFNVFLAFWNISVVQCCLTFWTFHFFSVVQFGLFGLFVLGLFVLGLFVLGLFILGLFILGLN